MFGYFDCFESLMFMYLMLLILFGSVSALILYIRQKRFEKKVEALHRRAVFERIKRERDEALKLLQMHKKFERIQRDISEATDTEAETPEPINISGLIDDVDNLVNFENIKKELNL